MDLHYSISDLKFIEDRVNRSIKCLEDNGTIIGTEHSLSVIKKLVEENRSLREEVLKKNTNAH